MRDFHMSLPDALDFPLIQAFALSAFHAETHPFCAGERDSAGYIAQEIGKNK